MTIVFELVWLILLAAALAFIQRRLHLETQALFLILTRHKEISIVLFSILLFPGVLLHECSHYLMARLFGVRIGRFSLVPRPGSGGRLQLGFVETASTDILRDALIGIAPLLAGGVFIAYAGLVQLGLSSLWKEFVNSDFTAFWQLFSTLPTRPDFWIWFYLTLAVSSTMVPSASDRRAWFPLGFLLVVLFTIILILDRGSGWMPSFAGLNAHLSLGIQVVAVVLAISLIVHALVLPLVWISRIFFLHLYGLKMS